MRTRSSWIWCWIIGAVLASGAGAQQYTTIIDNLPTCTGNRNGRIIAVSDATSDSDCTTGGATGEDRFVHPCICDTLNALGPYWKAVGGGGGGLPGANQVTESMLKVVNACTDEYVLTCETTTGDFEWQAIIGGSTGSTDNAVLAADGTGGATLQTRPITISDVAGFIVTLATTPGNALSLVATAPTATTGASQVGVNASLTASAAVASTDTAGAAAGGSVNITAGAAARNTSGNANGGDINLVPGAGIGTGTAGQVVFPHGSLPKPGLAANDNHTTGIHIVSGGTESLNYVINGTPVLFSSAARLRLPGAAQFGWISSTDTNVNEIDTILQRSAAGIVKLTNTLNLVPIASPPRTCDATAEGDIYSDTSHALCWCDASAWQKLSGAGTCA